MSDTELNLPAMKRCSICQRGLPLTDFDRRSDSRDGRNAQCKACRARIAHARYEQQKGRSVSPRPRFTARELADIHQRGEQRCLHCQQARPLSAFAVSSDTGHPRRVCLECRATQNRAWIAGHEPRYRRRIRARTCRQYGLTLADFEQMLKDQGHGCAICGLPLGAWHQTVDHDHATGRVRGIVHRHCNLALGNVREDPRVLVGLLQYLQHHHPIRFLRFACEALAAGCPQPPGALSCANSA
jgi:hypothetical protein